MDTENREQPFRDVEAVSADGADLAVDHAPLVKLVAPRPTYEHQTSGPAFAEAIGYNPPYSVFRRSLVAANSAFSDLAPRDVAADTRHGRSGDDGH
jgi:hypothetical protein